MVMVTPGQLVAHPAVSQGHLADNALLLQPDRSPEHGRVVRRKSTRDDPGVEVVYRPVVPVNALQKLPYRVAHVAWSCHPRKPNTLCNRLALLGRGATGGCG